jgi:hypothetical protein
MIIINKYDIMNNKESTLQNYKLIILVVMTCLFFAIGIWEMVFLFMYQNINKDKYEYSAYIYTITKSIINILYSIFIWSIIYKKYNKKIGILVILIFFINDIWLIKLFCNLKYYGIFKQIIILEFIILYIQSVIIMISLIYFVIKMYFCTKPKQLTSEIVLLNNNVPCAIITIPQTAIVNDLPISDNVSLPQAILIK